MEIPMNPESNYTGGMSELHREAADMPLEDGVDAGALDELEQSAQRQIDADLAPNSDEKKTGLDPVF
jgi:hypothetical protein